MDVNAALEVGTGLVIMYLLLALLCTVFTEIISTVLGWRAKNLREGIEKLLEDPKLAGLETDFFKLPVICKAYEMGGKHGPSYMASKQFASGMLDYLGKGEWPIGAGGVKPDDIVDAIKKLPESDTRRRLIAYATETSGDIEAFRLRIAQWYDDAMERWGGNFKRKTQKWSFWIAAAIVVALNADTFHVGVTLWNDPTVRAAVVASAPQLAAESDAGASSYDQIKQALRPFPLGWGAPNWGPVIASPKPTKDETQPNPQKPPKASRGEWAWWAVFKIVGLAFSAFAVSLGAPFWFQILNKLNAIRGSGRKPEPADA